MGKLAKQRKRKFRPGLLEYREEQTANNNEGEVIVRNADPVWWNVPIPTAIVATTLRTEPRLANQDGNYVYVDNVDLGGTAA